jgi:DNA-directed RNA polymerase subunit alpha
LNFIQNNKTTHTMAILAFQKPDKVIMLEADDRYGKFEFRPLEPGYGITVGNALRRILLSSLEGYAITSIKIDGVEHEFSTITGVIEDLTEIILNLKQVRFKKQIDDVNDERIVVTITGQEELKAGDLQRFLSGFKVLNPDLVICHMEPDVKLHMEISINKGRGYVPAEENKPSEAEFGLIAVDSIYTPIKNVRYEIENYRVEQKTDYEKLIVEIDTDGSIHPKEALKEAAKILIYHFMLFSDEKITLDTDEKFANEEFDEEVLHMRQLLKAKLVDLDLSVRALNCLKAAEVETLGDLVKFNKNDLLKFRNFGKKSLTELEELLTNMSLNFGMDTSKYKLDKD